MMIGIDIKYFLSIGAFGIFPRLNVIGKISRAKVFQPKENL